MNQREGEWGELVTIAFIELVLELHAVKPQRVKDCTPGLYKKQAPTVAKMKTTPPIIRAKTLLSLQQTIAFQKVPICKYEINILIKLALPQSPKV